VLHSKFLGVVSLAVTLLLAACETGVAPSNPFDPEAPSATRESASITGTIYLEGRTAHGGIQVRLDGYSGNAATTTTDGSFTLANLNSGVDYMVVAEYTQEPNLEFESARIAVASLNPGEAHSLEPATLIRAPFPPIVLDAVKSGDDAITVFWNKSEEADVTSYQVHLRAGESSFYSPHPTSCPDENSEVESILSCEITGLQPYEQYSFKVTATDSTGLESSYSIDDISQFVYPAPASVMSLSDSSQDPYGLSLSADDSLAYTLTTGAGQATLLEIDLETELETGCALLTTYNPDNGDRLSIPLGSELEVPTEGGVLQQSYGAPQFITDAQGNMTVWVPYTITYLDAASTPFSGLASLDLSAGLPTRTAEDTCQAAPWKHTFVSALATIGDEALDFTLASDTNVIARSCMNNQCGIYRYDIVDQRLQNPVALWDVPFPISNLAFYQGTLIAISYANSQLFIGDTATLDSTTLSTVAGPNSIAVIADTGYAAVTGRGANEIAIIDLAQAKDVFRLPAQSVNPKLAAAMMLGESNSATTVLYVAHWQSYALSMYTFTQPTTENPSPGHRYLTPLRCTGSCRIEIGGEPEALALSHDGSTVLVVDRESSNRLLQFSQTSPN
jgi:hypothetical protein